MPIHEEPQTESQPRLDYSEMFSEKELEGDKEPKSEVTADHISENEVPEGVRRMEAITTVWTTTSLVFTYIGVWIVLFWISIQQSAAASLGPYVTSAFASHSLVSATTLVCFIIAGVVQLPIAKLIDVWGRVEGFLVMILIFEVGLVIVASCKSVQAYTAGMVLYEIGFSGVQYILTVFVADTSQMKNRAIMLGVINTPSIATTWAGPPLAEAFYTHSTFRWAFGSFSIILPFICLPVVALLYFNQKKAHRMNPNTTPKSGRTVWQSCLHYAVEFDAIGAILIAVGLTIFLLPFTLAASQYNSWGSATVIVMIVLGFVLIVAFALFETYFAPKPLIPWSLLKDRTVFGACLFNLAFGMSYFTWDTYYSSYLMVVHTQSITNAGYIGNIYWNGVGISGILAGLFVHYTGDFKFMGLAGTALMMLGCGLMIHFRQPGVDIGYVIMCQVFIAIAGGITSIAQYMALLVKSRQEGHVTSPHIAILISMSFLFGKIGAAIGLCIAGGIWTNEFVPALTARLPDELKSQAKLIFSSIVVQLLAPVGSPTRNAINSTYGDMQRKLTISATCFLVPAIGGILMWKNVRATQISDKKGVVV